MSFLVPLGFLGLLGLAILILIYIIKPNYQQKLVSSTFVWKLSLKYQRKRIPISKLRNLLILICQILILILCAFLLAQPIIAEDTESTSNEKIIILDASASMYAQIDGETRFERAVNGITEYAEDVFDNNGKITLILAGTKAEILQNRLEAENQSEFFDDLDELLEGETKCTYGAADIDGAIVLAETITAANPLAEIVFYTGKQYLNSGKVTVVDVSDSEEWNVAILDARATVDEGYYKFEVDVACYGRDLNVELTCDVNVGPNQKPISLKRRIDLSGDIARTVEFKTGAEDDVTQRVFEYENVLFSVSEADDSFLDDNTFSLYGGVKPTLRVQYYSAAPNTFFSAALMITANAMRNRWDIDIDEVRPGGVNETPAYEGYDFYIFENFAMPIVPNDGVVFVVNPPTLLSDFGVTLGSITSEGTYTLTAENHPLSQYIDVGNFTVTRYTQVTKYDDKVYKPVLLCSGDPVLLSKKTADQNMAIMTFSVNFSDIAMTWDFSTLIYNMFEYYLPSTFSKYIYDVNDTVELNARGSSLKVVSNNGLNVDYNVFPTELVLNHIGVYTCTQTLQNGDEITESFYVKVPGEESNIKRVIDVLTDSVLKPEVTVSFDDLLVYFAAVLVALLFAEWWLQSRSSI